MREEEKPLVKFEGKTLLERTVETVLESEADDFVIAITKWTPKTEEFVSSKGWPSIMTPGEGYHEDVYFLLDMYSNYLSVNVDIPFLTAEAINLMLRAVGQVSMECVVERSIVDFDVPSESVITRDGGEYVWVGLNYVTASQNSKLMVFTDRLLALNVNSKEDLELARKMTLGNDD